MNYSELKEIERRPQKYWNVDGVPELVMGALWILWGGLTLIGEALPRRPVYGIYWLVVPVVLATSGFWGNWLIKRLKERITYPRAGYVETERPRKTATVAAMLVALAIAVGVIALFFRGVLPSVERLFPPGILTLIALAVTAFAVKSREPHLLWLALVSLALALWMYRSNSGFKELNWAFVWLGIASVILGAVRLRRFLRANP